MDERMLVRRVATAACVAALLTMPAIRLALGDHESWIAGVHFIVLGFALLGLRYRRISLGTLFGTTAALLFGVTILSFWLSTGTVAAGGVVVGYGSGPLWLAAAMGPLVFLGFPVRRAVTLVVGALLVFPLIFAVRTGGNAGDVLLSTGLWFQGLAAALVVCATVAVALLAVRSAAERQAAEDLQRRAARERSALAAAQRRRRALFSRTAADLRTPMAELTRAVDDLEVADGDAIPGTAERVAELSGTVLDEIVGSLRELVASVHASGAAHPADAEVAPVEPARSTDGRERLLGPVVVVGVLLAVLVDAVRLGALVEAGTLDPVALAAGGSRMVLVLFLGAAVVAVRRPDPVGWSAVVVALLVHPVIVLGSASAADTGLLVQVLVPAWRNAVLSTTFIVLLSAIVERRAREGAAARLEAAADEASSRALRRQEAESERTYGEAAHELKNPLAVITAGARTLATRSTLTGEQRDQLRAAVVRSTARLDERLREMRTVAGVADHLAPPAPTRVNVQRALEQNVTAANVGTDVRAVDLDASCADAHVSIVPNHLDHVVENLLGNAARYGQPDGPIRVVARVHDGEVHVEVSNQGGRLTPAQAQHVFEAYWRAADDEGHPAGSGLGLAIVARLVAGWGGTRWCAVSDGWTRVGFTIPLVHADVASSDRVPTLLG